MSKPRHSISRRLFIGAGSALVTASGLSVAAATEESATSAASSLTGVRVSLIADALRKIGHDPVKLTMTPGIKPLVNVGAAIIGPAVTTKWETTGDKAGADDIRR